MLDLIKIYIDISCLTFEINLNFVTVTGPIILFGRKNATREAYLRQE